MLSSCADELDTNNYVVSRPGQDAQYDYLKDYKPLKEYKTNPNLKVSAALTASEFNEKGMLYALAQTNFDEIVAGNAMKMASCVTDKGVMSFDNVTSFVNTAEEAGLTVYGHTLLWHSQQPVKWLASLIEDKPIPVDPDGQETRTEVDVVTYTDGPFPCYPMGCEPPVIDGSIHFVPTGDWSQFFVRNGAVALTPGDYEVILHIKSSEEGTIKLTAQNGWGADAQQMDGKVVFTTPGEFEDVVVKCPGIVGGNYDFILKPETFGATIDLFSVTIVKVEKKAAAQIDHQLVEKVTYEDGPFQFYPMGCEPPTIDGSIHFVPTGDWSQFFVRNGGVALDKGNYEVILHIKSSEAGAIKLTVQNGWGGDAQQLDGSVKFTTPGEFEDVVIKYNELVGGSYDLILKPETFGGTIDLNSVTINKLVEIVGPVPTLVQEVTYTDGAFPFYPMGSEPPVVDGAIHFEPTGDWSQFFITNAIALKKGNYQVKLKIKSTQEGTIKLTTQNGWGGDAQQMDGKVTFTKPGQFEDVVIKYDNIEGGNYDFILKPETFMGTLDVKSMTVYEMVEQKNVIELTPEEKRDTLIWAMDRWMNGMMSATQGKVVAWDLINEAISGGGNVGDGYYDLQHFEGFQQGSWDVGGENFFWQDYLGADMYAVYASKVAREAFAAVEGTNPSDLKLFINDYNLESTWDEDCKKMRSLLYWIGVWEKNGAQIDGIGTQMHISYYLDEASQNKQKACITRMFELMASSGKLCRISELDMGIYDKQFGNKVENITFEQEKAMGEYYKWIVSEYQRIIPADKQYGICQWCITDAPSSSGWRAGEPVGLWTQNYERKPAYAGFADGLAGK